MAPHSRLLIPMCILSSIPELYYKLLIQMITWLEVQTVAESDPAAENIGIDVCALTCYPRSIF